jgi:hypothetical protein
VAEEDQIKRRDRQCYLIRGATASGPSKSVPQKELPIFLINPWWAASGAGWRERGRGSMRLCANDSQAGSAEAVADGNRRSQSWPLLPPASHTHCSAMPLSAAAEHMRPSSYNRKKLPIALSAIECQSLPAGATSDRLVSHHELRRYVHFALGPHQHPSARAKRPASWASATKPAIEGLSQAPHPASQYTNAIYQSL